MPSISSQKQLRDSRHLDFCYLCGEKFICNLERTKDHVPPRKMFAICDRNTPLILFAHTECNSSRSTEDEFMSQLVGVLHGKIPRLDQLKLPLFRVDLGLDSGPLTGLHDTPFMRFVFRYVRAFHTALYKEYLVDSGGYIYMPFPSHRVTNGIFTVLDEDPGRTELTYVLKLHKFFSCVDSVVSCNSKCDYICIWLEFDDGRPFCLFALNLYDWGRLGEPSFPLHRGCLGWYYSDPPSIATIGTRREVFFSNLEPLDPFGL